MTVMSSEAGASVLDAPEVSAVAIASEAGASVHYRSEAGAAPGPEGGPPHRTYRYPTQAAPPDNPGEYNQFAAVVQVNRYDAFGNDIEADLFGATDVPMTLTSEAGSSDIVAPVIDYAGNMHIRINGAGWDGTHTFAGSLGIRALLPDAAARTPMGAIPGPHSTRQQRLDWLAARGVTGVDDLDDDELLTLIIDLLD